MLVVYTCVTNNYDWVFPPLHASKNIRFICFTDTFDPSVRGWEIKQIPKPAGVMSNVLASRYCKFFPWQILPEHDWSLYIDANIRLMSDPCPVLTDMKAVGAELAIPAHPERSDIWQEAEACKHLNKVPGCDLSVMNAQLARYQAEGLPKYTGLTENNIIFRSGDSARLLPVMEQWWDELQNGVQRDQLSLPYVLWSTGTPLYRLPFSARDSNPYFRIVPHRRNGGLYNYVQARRYHGVMWEGAFQSLRITRAIRRRVTKIFRKPGAD